MRTKATKIVPSKTHTWNDGMLWKYSTKVGCFKKWQSS